ncbi:hypothetical protein PS2_003064 [Malus domestica]
MGIKLDMNKAYDRVEWDFLKVVMGHLGFQRRWIDMVMCCVKTVEFSILINERPGKAFKPFRGLQQGDPLSPYLFLIISEVLSLLIKKAVHQGYLEGIRISTSGPVSLQKSIVYFGANTPAHLALELSNILDMAKVDDPGNSYVSNVCISIAGYVVLEIDAAMAKFWWAGANKDRGIHWINWKDLGRAKKDASWAWASLLEVKDLILKGARWQILERQKVQFWTNNWVPSIPARHLTPPFHTEISSESKVAEFIDLVLRVWNIDLLSHFVPKVERVTISHIQVGPLLRPDKLVWHFERNGSYSVKSVYKWCHNQLPIVNHDRPPSSHNIDSRVWAWVWSCKAPPKD